ncbi:MAG: UbiA family prenyltransferase [Planctomycetes bacterium]|nr:UbiA family prenyltransferase [Planctomycetota bacterium]
MIKLSHTVFALPFALCSAWLAAGGVPAPRVLGLVVICAVAARSAAMGFNRYVDRDIDARNPRTASRALPAGLLSPRFVLGFIACCSAVFLGAAALLGPICLALAPLVLAVLFGYSYAKRFTAAAHLVLGFALALAPLGAWVAVRGEIAGDLTAPLLLGALVMLWVAGFDVIYACQDAGFDRAAGLHAVPARFGVAKALWIARLLHVGAGAVVLVLAVTSGLGWFQLLGSAAFLGLLALQHTLVRASDLSRVDVAFFTLNGWASVIYFGATALDLALR